MVIDHAEGAQLPLRGTLAEKLEYLFDKIRPCGDELDPADEPGRKYTNREIAEKINKAAAGSGNGVTISGAYVGELRRGVATDPRASHIEALATAFRVDPAYFLNTPATTRIQEQLHLLDQLRATDVRRVALRRLLQDAGLSKESARLVEQMVARLQAVESQAATGSGSTAQQGA